MNLNFFALDLTDSEIKNRLTENGFDNEFSIKQKIYYNLIRPIVQISFKHKLQEKLNSRIKWKKDFIDESLISLLQTDKIVHDNFAKLEYKHGKGCVVILTHDVEEQQGLDFIPKVVELEEKYGFKSSWNIVPYKYKIDEGILKLIRNEGHEIGIHGYNHDGKLYYSEKMFNKRVPFINDALKRYGAVGFRSPMVHRNLIWLQRLNIDYDTSCFDYDPFQPFPGGTGSIWPFVAGKFVELPYTIPQDHTMFYVLKQKDITIWKNKIDWIVKNNGMILSLTHPDYLIEKKHFEMYEELLKYLISFKNAWRCLPKQISSWIKLDL